MLARLSMFSLVVCIPLLSACTGVEPAAVSAGASVAQTSVGIFDRGKALSVEYVTFDEAIAAVDRVADKLGLKVAEREIGPTRARYSLKDERNQSIVIVVQRRSAAITQIHADVGLLGEYGLAQLVHAQIVMNLVRPAAVPAGSLPPATNTP